MLYNTKKFIGLLNRAEPWTKKYSGSGASSTHPHWSNECCQNFKPMFRGTLHREVRMSRSSVLGQESEFLYYNVVITSKQMPLKQLENKKRSCSNQMHNICVLFENYSPMWLEETYPKACVNPP